MDTHTWGWLRDECWILSNVSSVTCFFNVYLGLGLTSFKKGNASPIDLVPYSLFEALYVLFESLSSLVGYESFQNFSFNTEWTLCLSTRVALTYFAIPPTPQNEGRR